MPVETLSAGDLESFIALGGKVDELSYRDKDSTAKYAVDFQYLCMNRWAFDKVLENTETELYDFASRVDFPAYTASLRTVHHYDIREPDFAVPGMEYRYGDLANLPLKDGEVKLASCLHVAEHVGLGRYGDKLDPLGMDKACAELERVLAIDGELLFAVPVGLPKVVFNSHRISLASDIVKKFQRLELLEYSCVSKSGHWESNAPLNFLDNDEYGCGMFQFVKRNR